MSDVEEIKNRISIVDLIGEYVRLTKAGSNWKALCPFHNEKTPSFMVSEERRSFHCFGCGKGGDIFTFVMEMEGVGFREALEQLAQKAGIQLKRSEKWERRDESTENKKKLYEILELAAKWYEKNLWEGKEKEKILKYLCERGFKDETIRKFRLGYAPKGWRNILDFLLKRGYKVDEIAKTGLLVKKEVSNFKLAASSLLLEAKTYQISNEIQNPESKNEVGTYYDRFRDRVMFPIQDIVGRVIGFSARVAPGGDEKTAKYINTPQSELYDKSKILYGLNFAKTEIKKRDEVILVEGNTDVIASHQAGFENTVAVSGTALTLEQIKIIKRYTENLKMAFDMDSAGQEAVKRSTRICLENDLNVKIVLLSSGKDAAEIIQEDKTIWGEAVSGAREIIEYFFEDSFSRHDSENPVEKKKIVRELLNILKDIANPVEKAHWIKVLAEKIGVREEALIEILRKVKSEIRTSAERKKNIPPPRSAGKEKAMEKRIIGLFISFPRETENQRAAIDPEDFVGEMEKEIIKKIKKEERGADLEKIKSRILDYESQKLIDEAVFEVEVERNEGRIPFPEEELKRAIKRHKAVKNKAKTLQIAQEIKEAEKSGDKKRVKFLLEKFQNLSTEIEE